MKRILMALAAAFALAGCTTAGPPRAVGLQAEPAQSSEPVVIVSFTPVRISGESWQGVAAGAAAGAVLANTIRQSAVNGGIVTLAGGVVGGVVGARWFNTIGGIEIVARRSDGQQIVVVQEDDGWKPWIGQEARLIGNGPDARIAR